MTNKEAIDWLNAIKEKYIFGGDERLDELRKEALDLAIKALEKPNRVLYLCDLCGCKGCEEGQNEDNHCQHTSDIAHATNFDVMKNEDGEVFGYVEKPERSRLFAQFNFDEEQQKQIADEAAQRLRDEIENGELVVKDSLQPVIIHHNGRDFSGYFDISRGILFASYLFEDVAKDFGFTWTEVEEEDKNHES